MGHLENYTGIALPMTIERLIHLDPSSNFAQTSDLLDRISFDHFARIDSIPPRCIWYLQG